VAEEHGRIKKGRKFKNVPSSILCFWIYGVTYILHTHFPPMETAEESKPTEKQRSSKHLIDDDPGGHIGPQGPHLASPQEQSISAGMGLTIHLCTMIGSMEGDRLMKGK
jgi:hypothetical protein